MTVADIEDFLRGEAEERVLATGGQFYASVDGVPVADFAVGVDGANQPVSRDSLFAVYCMGKPAIAFAAATLVAEGELSFDDCLGDVVDRQLPGALAKLPISALLAHTAGLHGLDAHTFLASTASMQERLTLSTEPPTGWCVGQDVAYGQVASWELLALALEDLAGEPVRDLVRTRVLQPAGVENDVYVSGMTSPEYAATRDRMAINAYIIGLEVHPILAERTRRFRCLASSAFGNTASARGLGRLFEAFLAAHRGSGPLTSTVEPRLLDTLVCRQSHGHDPVMGRACGYGYGFMVGLREHEFGSRVSDSAFGHTAYGGMTGALADPDHGIVIAFHSNGRVDATSALEYRRPSLIDSVYRSLVDNA